MAEGFTLPELPWARNALEPHITENTINFHYGKHHAGYVNKLNAAASDEQKGMTLEDLINSADGKVFNCAAQIWNHTFYWNCLAPGAGGPPTGAMADKINAAFGSFDEFKAQFNAIAGGHFGSGWAWVCQNEAGELVLVGTHDAGNPMTHGWKPIMTCDVWEHAYYLDYQNARGSYIDAWWSLVNWDFANSNLQ